jgi:hypothetical protein
MRRLGNGRTVGNQGFDGRSGSIPATPRPRGVLAGRDGALNRIRLRNLSPDSLARLAAVPRVARVEPMP